MNPRRRTTRVTEREPNGDNRASPADHLVPRYHYYLRRNMPHAARAEHEEGARSALSELAEHMR